MYTQLITASLLAGAAALAVAPAQECHEAKPAQDCCATQAVAESSTPFLAPAKGPVAVGRVVFAGDLAAATGKASFEGTKPEVKPLEIEPAKAEGCTTAGQSMDTTDRSLLISENGGIANVVILVEVAGAELKVPEKPFEMDQTQCRFEPHVVVIPAGATVEFLNSDQVSHNVHTYPKKNDAMNKTIAAGSKEAQVYAKTDQIEVKCDIHPWMNSYLVVTDTPFYAVTGADGSFSVAGLPEGTHDVEYWHEKLGKGKAEITVKADGTAEPFEVKLGERKGGGRRRR